MAILTKAQITAAIDTLLGSLSILIRKANHKTLLDNINDSKQQVIQSYTTTERNALTPVEQQLIYNSTVKQFQYYSGSQWNSLAPVHSAGLADANYMLKVSLQGGVYVLEQSTHVFDNDTELVMGGIKITGGAPSVGKVLTSDADGIGTWGGANRYKAALTQTGTGNPTVDFVTPDSHLGSIVWTRNSLGTYDGTLAGAFPADLWAIVSCSGANFAIIYQLDINTIRIQTYDLAGNLADGILNYSTILIEVF